MTPLPVLLLGAALLCPAAHAHQMRSGAHGASAAGQTGSSAAVSRSVTIGMHDAMRFSPARLTVRRGQTVQFDVANEGQVLHELVLGSAAEIAQHRRAMRQDPGMAHQAPYMVHVAPGQRGTLVWQFSSPGVFEFACLLPGHYEAGMRGTVTVSDSAASTRTRPTATDTEPGHE